MDKIEAIEKLRNAVRRSDFYNLGVAWIFHNSAKVFIDPTIGDELNLPEVIEIGSADHKEWLKHLPLFNRLLDQETSEDTELYPLAFREPVRAQ